MMRRLILGFRLRGRVLARVAAAPVAACLVLLSLSFNSQAAQKDTREREVRALWVVRTSLTSSAAIRRMVKEASANGFNTLLVQVRGLGYSYYRDSIEPIAPALIGQPVSFDPLQETIIYGRAAGLAVHAWINVNFVASAHERPTARRHIAVQHPEWLMVPRSLAEELSHVPTSSRAYITRLSQWTRTQSENVEGLYASPVQPASADHLVSVVSDLVSRYALNGLHLDYARYPRSDFDYGRATLDEFRAAMLADLTPAERADLDRKQASDLLAYVDAFPARWTAFRRARLTALVTRLRSTAKERRPGMIFSAAVVPDPVEAATGRLQEWGQWVEKGLLDVVCPMIYTPDARLFGDQTRTLTRTVPPGLLWAGIGAYRLTPAQTIANIDTARQAGVAGIALFSYDAIAERGKSPKDYLSQVSRAAFAPTGLASGGR